MLSNNHEKLKNILEEKGIDHKDLSKICSIHHQTIAKCVRGNGNLSIEEYQKIADKLEVNLEDILPDEADEAVDDFEMIYKGFEPIRCDDGSYIIRYRAIDDNKYICPTQILTQDRLHCLRTGIKFESFLAKGAPVFVNIVIPSAMPEHGVNMIGFFETISGELCIQIIPYIDKYMGNELRIEKGDPLIRVFFVNKI